MMRFAAIDGLPIVILDDGRGFTLASGGWQPATFRERFYAPLWRESEWRRQFSTAAGWLDRLPA